MFNLTNDEIVMVDGGGDGGYGTAIGCSLVGGAVGLGAAALTKNSHAISTSASIATGICTTAMSGNGNSNGNQGNRTSNVGSGGYMGNGLQSGGGMMGSSTGGRGHGY